MPEKQKRRKPYSVVARGEGCPICQHRDQFDIVFGPTETAQSQSWGNSEEADYICELMNEAYSAGRASYAQQVLDELNEAYSAGRASYAQQVLDELKAEETEDAEEKTEVIPPPFIAPDDIPF